MRIASLALLLGALLSPGLAAQRSPVRVEFRLAARTYHDMFNDADRARLETAAARLIAEKLNRELPVLALEAGDSAAFRLEITLDSRGASAVQPELGLSARLIGPDSSTQATWWAVFCPPALAGACLGSDTRPLDELLLRQLAVVVDGAELAPLVRDHLSWVPITRVARPVPPPGTEFGWVAPLDRSRLCFARGTLLRVRVRALNPFGQDTTAEMYSAKVKFDFDPRIAFGGAVPDAFANFAMGVFAPPEPGQSGLPLPQDTTRWVDGVFLAVFHPDRAACARPPDPEEAELTAGGGQ